MLSLLTTTFVDARERGKAFGIYGAIAGSGASVGMLLGGVLTEAFDWRAVMYVNLVLAVVAGAGGITLLRNQAAAHKPSIDVRGTVAVSAGLFALVFGLSRAETDGWGSPLTIGMLAAAAVLLVAFVWLQRRVEHPLLPLRVLADRNRAASQLAIVLASVSMFGAFLFLTYYLQQNLGYSPIQTGVAFLPMTVVVMLSATLASTKLVPRVGPRVLVTTGMALGAAAMLYLTGLGVHSSYATAILPTLVAIGVGLGLVFAPAMNTATLGVRPEDAGVASAAVNTSQQVGGAVGTALLSTLAASATAAFLSGTAVTPAAQAAAAVHGYTTAFAWSAGIFAVGAVIAGLLYARGVPQITPGAEPAPAVH